MMSSVITMLFASVATLYQRKIKRFLAYSSISHVGYMLIGLSTSTLVGLHAFFIYIFVYMLTVLAFFGLILSLKKNQENKSIIYLTDLLHINDKNSSLLKVLFVLVIFSMAGIPPLLGFFSKFYIFFSSIEASSYFLVLVGVISSTIGAFYYIRVIKILNFEVVNSLKLIYSQSTFNLNVLVLLVLVFCFFFFSPNFLFLETYKLCLFL